MPKKQKIITILTIATIFGLLIGGYFLIPTKIENQTQPIVAEEGIRIVDDNLEKEPTRPEERAVVNINQATLEIEEVRYQTTIEKNTSVYDFMDKLRNNGEINFKEKTYIGLGKFIDEINGVRGNGSEFWIYYVNGNKAQIGVSNYRINPGDVVSWKYEKDIN